MFEGSAFAGDISNWDVSNVADMSQMFMYSPFDGDISRWDIRSVSSMVNMFLDGSLSTENYDTLLVSWSQQEDAVDITFHAGNAQYSAGSPAEARAQLISKGWEISDGGPVE